MAKVILGTGKVGAMIDEDFYLAREAMRRKEDYRLDPTPENKEIWDAAKQKLEDFREK